ncbi:MAG TPA: LemA family protein [Armatimonadota bacterium]|nr:LemA family protein [Armatimonadota bacterium]HOP79120.1 LemA family protein [Armatimonadota bacterium]HPP75312.1 LemA family protein [Armatimonadota bacterium]
MSIGLIVFLVIAGLVIAWVIFTFNRVIILRNRIENAWAQIDVQLRRRYDLIPNLVETVKGYAAHEKEVFQKVTEARAAMASAQTVTEQGEAQNMLTDALKSLFAVAEAYPDLKANQNFLLLQEELSGTESKIAYSRQFYNDTVMAYNSLIQTFPANILAGAFGFQSKDYFPMEDVAREPIKVQF